MTATLARPRRKKAPPPSPADRLERAIAEWRAAWRGPADGETVEAWIARRRGLKTEAAAALAELGGAATLADGTDVALTDFPSVALRCEPSTWTNTKAWRRVQARGRQLAAKMGAR